ncbi:uncharacterized protein [Eurosta solidaginis]|uniref:uncharacterized protein isoform X1 n=1 Tax=Eurosta solidaginis TaxID=178769 RepID=UPI003530DEB4
MPAIQPSSSHRHSLPKLQLTKFSGNHTEWLDFHNMFTALVHNNVGLNEIEKFQYLRSCLTHGAFRLIQSLEVTTDNYNRAIDLLMKRYDNKRYIFQSHVQAMFDSKFLKTSSASSLREFIDSINSHLRALQSLASRTQITDGILLHFIVSKLDPEIQVKWEEYVTTKWDNSSSSSLQLPTWDDLATFIERRCHTVNIIEVNRKSTSKASSATKSSALVKSSTSLVSSVTNKCLLCNEAVTHSPFKCEKFNAMDPMQRYSIAKKNQLCLNCLGTGHTSSKCPSANRCQHCKVSHHTLLHRQQPQCSETTHSPPSAALKVSTGTSEVILATALVQIYTNHGTRLIVRALVDSASQLNFMTEHAAQLLHLKRTKIDLEITGIGALRTKSYQGACISIQSLHNGFSSVMETVILPSISTHQPQNCIDVTHWGIPKNIKLADRTFNCPGPIDLLIGAGLFFDILSVGQIKLDKNLPALQKTQLGWIVAGAIRSRPLVSSSSREVLEIRRELSFPKGRAYVGRGGV